MASSKQEMKYAYKQLKDPYIEDVNDLGQQGWRFIDRNRVKDSDKSYEVYLFERQYNEKPPKED